MKAATRLTTSLFLTLNALSLTTLCAHSEAAILDPQPVPTAALPANRLSNVLEGSASLTQSVWAQYFDAGQAALENCQFHLAERKLQAALNELRKRNCSDLRVAETKTALAEALLGEEHVDNAEHLLVEAATRAQHMEGGTIWHARALSDLAQAYFEEGKTTKAEQVCREAIAEQERLYGQLHHDVGKSREILARILGAEGLEKASALMHKQAVAVLEKNPGIDSRDLAAAEYGLAMELKAEGEDAQSQDYFKQSFSIQDKLVHFNRSMEQAGKVTVRWEPGNPRSRQIADGDYPLKYVIVNGVRVAATLVRSENVIAALISISNCTRSRIDTLVGPVGLEQLAPKHKTMMYVAPSQLDMALEAEHVTDLTWRRAWLNHIEKTRRIPGYLADGVLDIDNFFGNNTFGDYANWGTVARARTPIVTREQFYHNSIDNSRADDSVEFLSAGAPGLQPTYLDPGDSKTGLVYFKHEKFDRAMLKIIVGNVLVEIPFAGAGPGRY